MLPEIRVLDFIFPTYFIYQSLIYTIFIFLLPRWCRHEQKNIRIALNLALIILISGVLGGRAFHILFENLPFYRRHPEQIFYFWQGGFVFYGGVLFSVIACWFYLRRNYLSFWDWADFAAPIVATMYAFGRFGCFLAGCCYGVSCQLPWAIRGLHPTQLYAIGWEFSALIVLLFFRKRWKKPGQIFSTWLILHGVGRIFMESFRGDFRGSLVMGQSISTVISIFIIALGIALFSRTMISK